MDFTRISNIHYAHIKSITEFYSLTTAGGIAVQVGLHEYSFVTPESLITE